MTTTSATEALRVLGLEQHPGLEPLRRAYLRALSERPAEGYAPIRGVFAELTSWPHPRRYAPAAEGTVEVAAPHADPYRAPPIDSLLTALARAPDAPARVALLERATEAHPSERGAWEELAFELEALGRPADAIALLRRAIEHGHATLRRSLTERHPEALEDAELAAVRDAPDAPAVGVAIALAMRGEVAEADRRLALATNDEHREPEARWGELVLTFIERGHADAARRAWSALDDARSESNAPAAYEQTGELVAVHAAVPLEVRAALARALRGGDVMLSRDALVSFAERHGVSARDRVRRLLDAHAPTIAKSVGDFVWREPPPANFRPPISFVLLLVVGVIAGIGELLGGPPSYEEHFEEEPRDERAAGEEDRFAALAAALRDERAANEEDRFAALAAALRDDAARSVCEAGSAEQCALARAWALALDARDCTAAAQSLASLLEDHGSPVAAVTADRLRAAQRITCPDGTEHRAAPDAP